MAEKTREQLQKKRRGVRINPSGIAIRGLSSKSVEGLIRDLLKKNPGISLKEASKILSQHQRRGRK